MIVSFFFELLQYFGIDFFGFLLYNYCKRLSCMERFQCFGILWNDKYEFLKDFLKDVDSYFNIEKLYFLDINNSSYEIVKHVYPEMMPDEYAVYKADMLNRHNCSQVVVFSFCVDSPDYLYNSEEFQNYCVQVKNLKMFLREKYTSLIKDYEHDILAHFADNEYESSLVKNTLNNNKSKITKVLRFDQLESEFNSNQGENLCIE